MKMKKKMILLVSLLLLTAAVLGGMPQDAWADTQSKEYVVDDAGLFTDKEKEQLTKMCRKASDACKTDVVILTQSKMDWTIKNWKMMYAALLMKATAMMKAVRSRMQLSMSLI